MNKKDMVRLIRSQYKTLLVAFLKSMMYECIINLSVPKQLKNTVNTDGAIDIPAIQDHVKKLLPEIIEKLVIIIEGVF